MGKCGLPLGCNQIPTNPTAHFSAKKVDSSGVRAVVNSMDVQLTTKKQTGGYQ
jgi:hypothetical protein